MSTLVERVWLAEINGYNPVSGQEETLRFATAPIEPFPSSDPDRPDAHYPARLKGSGSLSRELYSGMRSYGGSSVNAGEVTLSNADGALDYLIDWGFDGRDLTLYEGVPGEPFASFGVSLKATMSQPEFTYTKSQPARLVLRVRDYQDVVRVSVQTEKYAGTNVGASGNEGTEDDIAGRPKPLTFGGVSNIRPAPCNAVAYCYQVHAGSGASVTACYDNGLALIRNDINPAPGEYAFDAATGIVTLGGTPAGEITCDVTGPVAVGATVAGIIKYLVIHHTALTIDDLIDEAFVALDLSSPYVVGIYLDEETSVADVIDRLCASVGAYWTFNRDGKFTVGRIEQPSAPAVWSFERRHIVEITRVVRQEAIPPYHFSLRYARNWLVQSGDGLAGAVSADRRAWLAEQYRTVSAEDLAVKEKHLLSQQMERDSLLTTAAQAQAECTRLLNLYKVDRHTFRITVKSADPLKGIELGSVIQLTLDRFGLNDGRLFVVLGIQDNLPREGRMTFTIWG